MKQVKNLIIGGGISGLAAGRTLADAGEPFTLLAKELGGRMLTSKSLTVDYGASYITSAYHHVGQYVDRGDPLRLRDLHFLVNGDVVSTYNAGTFLHSAKLLQVVTVLDDFCRRMNVFRQRCLIMSQIDALALDPVLTGYTSQPASEFVTEQGIEYFDEHYFEPVLHSTVFVPTCEVNTFYYLAVLVPLVLPTFTADYRHALHRLTKGWNEQVVHSPVERLLKLKNGLYRVVTSHGQYEAQNVILALPHAAAQKIYPIPAPGKTIGMYTLHVVGEREEPYRNKKVVFFQPKHHDITILWRQYTGSDIIFSMVPNPNLDKYYEWHYVVKRVHWPAALTLTQTDWVPQQLDANLYLASDYNICGLEDSFITGVYAARQILAQ